MLSRHINRRNPIGSKGDMAESFCSLMREMWSGSHRSYAPRHFKSVLGKWAPQFSGYRQHDAQELLAYVLDALHEDLNAIQHKPLVAKIEADGSAPLEEVADRSWEGYLRRNRSPLIQLFHGLLKSRIECPDCQKISITFDPFLYLPLPLPSPKKALPITLVPLDNSLYPILYHIPVNREGITASLLKDELIKLANHLNRRSFFFCYVSHGKTRQGIPNTAPVYPDHTYDLYAVESPSITSTQLQSGALIRIQMTQYRKTNRYPSDQYFARPHFFVLDPSQITGESLYHLYWNRVQRMLNGEDYSQDKNEGGFIQRVRKSGPHPFPGPDKCPFKLVIELPLRGTCVICKQRRCMGCTVPLNSEPLALEHNTCMVAAWSKESYAEWINSVEVDRIAQHPSAMEAKKNVNMSIQQCFELFSQPEVLSPQDAWYCPSCKDHKQATKKIDLWNLPEVLIVQLKRFQYVHNIAHRINSSVSFPAELDLQSVTLKPGENCRYRLTGVIHHSGGVGGGHYTAHARNSLDGRWYSFNDSSVSLSEPSSPSGTAYVLFYQRLPHSPSEPQVPSEEPASS